MTIVARRSFPPNSLKELIDYTAEQGEKITYAHAGAGTASHICGVLFASETGARPITIPYKGTGPAMIDLLGGQVDFMCDQTTNTTNQIQSGEIKSLRSDHLTSDTRLVQRSDRHRSRSRQDGTDGMAWNLRSQRNATRGDTKAHIGAKDCSPRQCCCRAISPAQRAPGSERRTLHRMPSRRSLQRRSSAGSPCSIKRRLDDGQVRRRALAGRLAPLKRRIKT